MARTKKKRKTRNKTKTEGTKDHHSESHKLHIEIKEVRAELERTNREYEAARIIGTGPAGSGRPKRKTSTTMKIIWIVISLIYISMIATSIGTYLYKDTLDVTAIPAEHTEEIIVTGESSIEHEINAETQKAGINETEKMMPEKTKEEDKYYGVMLRGLAPIQYEYQQGEDAVIESVIDLKSVERLEATARYELFSPEGERLYRYSDGAVLGKEQGVMRKAILLTENYKPGTYTVRFKAGFKINQTPYALSGETSFNIIEKQKPSIKARLAKVQINPTLYIMLILTAALNLLIVYKSWKIETKE